MKNLRTLTFYPAFVCMLITVYFTVQDKAFFIETTSAINNLIIDDLSWLFSLSAVLAVMLVVYVFFAPISRVKIGGEEATPILSPFKWFAVSLTTVIAMGILFWSVAEPIVHYYNPPEFLNIEPHSAAAVRFSMSTIFVHWTITPYCIYTVSSLVFALALYNLKMKFSIGSMLRPFVGKLIDGPVGDAIDGLALFAVVMGMSATLTSGILVIGDGLTGTLGLATSPVMYGMIALVIIGTALFSASTGLHRGIQILSRINTWFYFGAIAFIFLLGPTSYILSLGVETFGIYLSEFFQRNMVTGASGHSQWPGWWTVAFFASWFAWAPLTSLFLGKIARGYTVRQFIIVNVILPCLFGFFWFSTFSGTSIYLDDLLGGELYRAYQETGFASVIYVLFDQFPLSSVVSTLFVLVCFITFITAADSNTDAIGGLCTEGTDAEHLTSPLWIKAFWGLSIAFVAWISASYIGVDAVKMLFNLAGLPGMLIVIGAGLSLIKLISMVKVVDGKAILEPATEPDTATNVTRNIASLFGK
ncbi:MULTISPECIES: BCCT family transporter [unclassified Photobacterium]|uniref:BCCT family transporter n=1 Tax=unclassified Photobacterium TaxID=2628852 RepID=UPI0021C0CAEE|nr:MULTISPECIES: BCCT family transporter [unclassified Photobacterium]UXI03574.1 BCCT family transporter [Photobacterium sp. TY1-4]